MGEVWQEKKANKLVGVDPFWQIGTQYLGKKDVHKYTSTVYILQTDYLFIFAPGKEAILERKQSSN